MSGVSQSARRPSAALAADTAARQALVVQGALDGDEDAAAFGEERYYREGRETLTSWFEWNPDCLFDHESWRVAPIGPLTVRQAFALGRSPADTTLAVEGGFVTSLTCPSCHRRRRCLFVRRALERSPQTCPRCDDTVLVAPILSCRPTLSAEGLTSRHLARQLGSLGLRSGDILTIRCGARLERVFCDWPQSGGATADAGASAARKGRTLAVVGLGALGSHLIPHVAEMHGIDRVILVDFDDYEHGNLRNQAITAADVGESKVDVQARVLRAMRPEVEIAALAMRVQDVPPAYLAGAVIAACLDSRAARQACNEICWRVGYCWIDAAVCDEQPEARVIAYRPGENAPCLECSWSSIDYAALEQVHPCRAENARRRETVKVG